MTAGDSTRMRSSGTEMVVHGISMGAATTMMAVSYTHLEGQDRPVPATALRRLAGHGSRRQTERVHGAEPVSYTHLA